MLESVTAAETVFGETLSRPTSDVPEEVLVTGTVRLTLGMSLRKGTCDPGKEKWERGSRDK